MICYKKHQRIYTERTSTVIAMCDENLIGKKLKGKNTVLDLGLYGNFYNGEKIPVKKAEEILDAMLKLSKSESVSFNLVGKDTVKVAGKFVDATKAHKFGAVPHLQIYAV